MIERDIQNIALLASTQKRNSSIAEIASVIAETNLGVDTYFYRLKNGQLFSSTHNIPVEASTSSKKDKELIRQIESWAKNNEAGFAVWISPPSEPGEKMVKITLMRIISGANYKMVENRSILIQLDKEKIKEIVDFISACSIPDTNKTSLEDVRYTLFILGKPQEALNLLEQFYQEGWNEHKKRIKKATTIQQALIYDGRQNTVRKISQEIGPYSLSCPTIGIRTTSSTVYYRPVIETASRYLECTCPFCHSKVKARIENGKIHCPICKRSADYYC